MTITAIDNRICEIQETLLDMTLGHTRTVYGRTVTRWGKDAFELDTWGHGDLIGSESTAEIIAEDE